jgi:hypothetical protein
MDLQGSLLFDFFWTKTKAGPFVALLLLFLDCFV